MYRVTKYLVDIVFSNQYHPVFVSCVCQSQARDLEAMDAGESSDPYCKVNLGRERQKTKSISGTVNPKWR